MKLWRVGVSAVGVLAAVGCVGGEVSPSAVSPVSVNPSVVSTAMSEVPAATSIPTPIPTSAPTPIPTLTPTPTPTWFESYPGELPTEDPDSAVIIAAWQEYQRVYEKFVMAPNKYADYTETQYVTTGHESTVILDRIDGYRNGDLALVRGRAFRDLEVAEVESQPDGTATSVLTYCLDLDSVEIMDVTSGELVERSGVYEEVAWMRQGLDGVWRVEGLNTYDECL